MTTKKATFSVNVIISNKPAARDPEGETILRDLVNKSGFEKRVKSIRAGKYLKVVVEASDGEEAKRIVERMCNELRMFNPAAHTLVVEVGRITG